MNRWTKTGTVLGVLALAGLLLSLPAQVTASAGGACAPVRGDGVTNAVSDFMFVGSGTLSIGGEMYEVAITTTLLGPPNASDDGTLHAPTSHFFEFPGGSSITTMDRAVLEPTDTEGLFTLNSNMEVVAGEGDYAGGRGRLHGHGQIDLIGGQASFRINGVVCVD